MKLIVARNYQQAIDYVREQGMPPPYVNGSPNHTWRYAYRFEDISGMWGAEVIKIGEYWHNPIYKNVQTQNYLEQLERHYNERLGNAQRRNP